MEALKNGAEMIQGLRMRSVYIDRESNTIADLAAMETLDSSAVPGSYLITRINVPITKRGEGFGTAMLKRILSDADRLGVTLYVQPMSSGQWSNRTLRRWYLRHGFRKGENYYTREPQKPETE